MAPRLTVHDALGRRTVAVDKPTFTIGRRAGHDLQLAGSEVSRDHAEIVTTADGFVIRDRGSRYGTLVNGETAKQHRLAHGDRIEFGRGGPTVTFLLTEAARDDDAPATPVAAELRQVAVLLQGLREMGGDRVLDEVLAMVLDSAIDATGAERGFIMMATAAGALEMKLARRRGHITLPASGFDTSRKIPEAVFAGGELMVVTDLLEGELAAVHTGTVALGIRHVLCAPLHVVRYVERRDSPPVRQSIGVLYLDSREKGRLLSAAARSALETLASEAALAIDNARLYQEALEKARLDQELRVAFRIQQALLPEGRRAGAFFDAFGASVPSRAIGGDFFDYQDLPGEGFRLGLGDVTGKGPSAALLTALVQGVLATNTQAGNRPDEVVALINRVLLDRRIESRFLTLFLGMLSPDGMLTYCNAAQNPPLVFSGGNVHRLDVGGTLIGAFTDARYEHGQRRLVVGDTLVIFSDGVTEAMNVAGEEFGEDRVRLVVESVLTQAPEQILSGLFEAVRVFTDGVGQFDDLTAVILRYTGLRD